MMKVGVEKVQTYKIFAFPICKDAPALLLENVGSQLLCSWPSLQNTDNRRRYTVYQRQKPKLISMQ
jgi:hypothetical protein